MKKKCIGLSLILPYYLFAQSVTLDNIEVVDQSEQVTNTMNVDLQKIEQQQSNSIFDLFKNNSSIDVAGGGSSNAKRIYVRGVESSTLNITLDGASQGKNIFQHRGNELGINPDILKVVNVKTAFDASKGGALGGSIEMSTKDAQDFLKNGKNTGGIISTGYTTNTNSKIGSVTAYGVYDDHYGVVASVSGVNSDNYEDGNNQEMLATAYKDRNYFLKFTIADLNNHNLNLSFNQNINSGEMQWGKTGSDKGLNVNPALLENIESTTTKYSAQHNYSDGKLLNLDTNLNFTNILVDRIDTTNEYENDKIGLKVQNHFYIDTKSLNNKISVGFQIEDEESTSTQAITRLHVTNDPSHYAATSSLGKALFIQNKTTIDNLDINYGVRFDDYELETGLGNATDSTLSPNFGLDYRLNEKSTVYANYGKASRMTGTIPFTWMMSIVDDRKYSKDLQAEESTRYELGYEFKQESLIAANDTLIFDANIFKTDVENLILPYSDQNKGNGTRSYAGEGGAPLSDIYNSDETHTSKGFEIKASYYLDKYFGTLAYSYIDTNTEFEENGEPLTIRRVAGFDSKKVVLNTGMEIIDGFAIDYTLTAVDGIDNDQTTRGGYVTHDISTKYQTSQSSPWTFFVAVSNLTNKYYAPHTTLVGVDADDYRREMGRDYKFTVKYIF